MSWAISSPIGAGDTDTQLTATLDPTFTTTDTSGKFEFSPGVTSGAPEPGTWILLLLGVGGIGAALRMAQRARGAVVVG